MPEVERQRSGLALLFAGTGTALRDAVVLAVLGAAVGLAANATVHPESIPFVAEEAYDILVPCPEPGGDVAGVSAADPTLADPATFVVDARGPREHAEWHFRDAMNVTYDYLDPTPDEAIAELARHIARSRAQRVAVYGDGDDPDTGEQLGKEISGHGIKNVSFVTGGAEALRKQAAGGAR